MSYCVNCGVELEATEKKCVLCGCEVVNPSCQQTVPTDKARPYPNRIDEMTKKENRRFSAFILTSLFILPALICFFLNILYFNQILWSIYVIGAFAFLWTCIVIPLINKKMNLVVLLFFDFIAAALYLYVINIMLSDINWFFPLAFPVLLILWVFLEIIVFLSQRNIITGFNIPALGFIYIGLLCLAIDIILNLFLKLGFMVSWSVFVMIPAFVLAIIFNFIEKKKNIKEELIKRFHF
ncbi:MAG: DUF6320 domain-containing protein [Saccharofermentanales bacterium]